LLPKPVKYLITTVMIVVGVIAMYTILNAGRPDSLLRPLFPDPTTDVYVAVAASLTVFILGFFIFFERDRQGFKGLVRMNADHIKRLREEGQADGVIADSILNAMGSTSGYRHNLARKKLLIALSEFDHRSEPQA
jgi:hypothetical protein